MIKVKDLANGYTIEYDNERSFKMEYKRIFTDIKTREVDYPKENFIRISVYAPSEWKFPYLMEIQTGNNHSEDWDTQWSVYNSGTMNDAKMIRQAIKMIDEYEFKE